MIRAVSLTFLIFIASCDWDRAIDNRKAAANCLTAHYTNSRMAQWHIRARAAGGDCAVLILETSIVLDDSMIGAMHHGIGAYDVYDGGVQRFCREHSFRGVAYKDSSGRVWTYGEVPIAEGAAARPCH